MVLELLVFLVSVCSAGCFMGGAPDFTCRDPSVFHTQRINASHEGIIMPQDQGSNPYSLEVGASKFRPGQKITVTMHTSDPDKKLKGFFIQAVQADITVRDLRRRAFGTFVNTTSAERPSVCQPSGNDTVGGITHTSNTPNSVIKVVWIAPKGPNPGPVQFLATGVMDYNTYWTNIRSPVLRPGGYRDQEASPSSQLTPTAAWYQWLQYLQYLRNQQAANLKINSQGNKSGASTSDSQRNNDRTLTTDSQTNNNRATASDSQGKGNNKI